MIKEAYEAGFWQALADCGITKEAGNAANKLLKNQFLDRLGLMQTRTMAGDVGAGLLAGRMAEDPGIFRGIARRVLNEFPTNRIPTERLHKHILALNPRGLSFPQMDRLRRPGHIAEWRKSLMGRNVPEQGEHIPKELINITRGNVEQAKHNIDWGAGTPIL